MGSIVLERGTIFLLPGLTRNQRRAGGRPLLMLGAVTLLFAALLCTQSGASMGPLETLRSRDLQIRQILDGKKARLSAEEDAQLRDLVGSIVDFERHTRESFGVYWYELSEADQAEATRLVTILLERSMLKKVYEHRSDRVQYVSELIDPADPAVAKVLTLMTRGDARWEILYRMRLNGAQWKIVDIILQGASSVERNRSTFYKELSSSGAQSLLEKLRKKVDRTP